MQFEIQWQTVEGQIAPWARMQEVTTALKDYEKNSRVKVPRIFTEVKVTVRVQTCILNLDAVSRALGRPLIYIMKYFSYKLGTMIYKKKGRVIIHGLHGKKKLYQLLKDFSQKFVLCPKCEKRTALSANEAVDTLQKRCTECDYEGHLYSTDKLSSFIWRYKIMEPMSEQMKTTLPKSKETSYAAKYKSIRKDALVAKSAEPAVKVTKQNKNNQSAVCEIPVNKQMGKKIIISNEANYADKLKSKINTLVGNPTGPEVKATNQKKNILPVLLTMSINKRRGKKIPKSKETNCADKLRSKKNTVAVKSTAPAVDATKRKKNRLPVVRDIPRHYMYTDIQDDEYLLSDFTDSEDYDYYLKKFEESEVTPIVENMVVECEESNTAACGKRKLFPKILISRIQKNVKEEDIIENIKDKNPWLRYLIKNEDDFKKVATLQADTKGRQSYIIRCSPQVRGNIALRGNKLNIQGGCYNVRDTYHVIRCTKCQKFGHKRDQCRGELVCPKCGKEHWLKDCDSEISTCLHCQGPHITGNRSCLKYKEQEARIKDRTDHGEHLEYVMPDSQIEGAEKQQQIIKQEARRKKKEKNKQVNMESNKKLNKAKTKNATDLGEQQVIPVVKNKKKKQKKQLTMANNKVEAGTKNTPDQGEQVIIPAVKSKKEKQKKQLTMENNKVEAGTKNTTDQGEQKVIKAVVKRKKKQKMQLTLENNNRVEPGIKNTTDHREHQVIIPIEEKMKQTQEMQLPLENNNRVKAARTKITIAFGEQVIKPELETTRRYGKYLYIV